ncbi:hypothetical protein AGDE_09037 [Angomonas deanei]|uniref:AN1-like Zinc finger containing protein n=1 Tax=Angomonas deanei TaxID=59799 RepID=A0A7G2CE89_9TRYP|nr:hypothetical protein AGDE_09037 [Angomonas deanei]CAD2217194.1 hypothetical protein, conserved [Angomonas deanei]|eukprot:EPY31468.1 hypothetical protein AGDE_09037 [Angomonas deanei]
MLFLFPLFLFPQFSKVMEFNDSGDVCMECGVFDFLPGTCPRCQQIFCRDHMATHHRNLPSLTVLLAGDVAAQLEALPLCGDANPSEGLTVPHTDADPTAAERPSCHSCGQQWCVLSPCEQCGERFCPVHRFHEHGEDKKGMTQTTKGRSEPVPPSPGEESTTTHALCQPYTVANPVVLAPSDYKSRMMACSFFVLDRSTSSSAVELGVCSASVATESSVGQIIERWMDRVLPNRKELTASVSLYTVRAAKNPAVKVPQVTLEPFTSLGTIMREALASFDSLLVCLPPVEEEEARQYVQTLLFSSSPQLLQVRKDPRVRSLTAKLYISSQKRIKPEEPTVVDTAQPEDATPSVKEKTALSSCRVAIQVASAPLWTHLQQHEGEPCRPTAGGAWPCGRRALYGG